jgi:Arc/MetJ family transcription regulator
MHTRTNIVIDDHLMSEALAASGLKTKREVVEECMRQYVQLKRQSRLRELRGKVNWVGDLNAMRTD